MTARLSPLCLVILLTTSCATPSSDACSSLTKFVPDDGWEQRLTDREKKWAVVHNRYIGRIC